MQYLEIIKLEMVKILEQVFLDLGVEKVEVNFSVDFPQDLSHGDVTSNVCLVAAKILNKSPKEVYEILLPHLTSPYKGEEIVQKVEFANPGFMNFWIKSEIIQKELEVKLGSDDGKFLSKKYYGKRVLVEHTSINLFKQFHIGHLLSNFTGEFVHRIIKEVGGDSVNLSYPSDISIGVAKAIYIIKNNGGLGQEIFKHSNKVILTYMGGAYVRGVTEFKKWEENLSDENNQNKIKEVKDLANNLFNNIESEELEIYNVCKKANIDDFKKFTKMLGSDFENFIYESEAGVEGKRIVLENAGDMGEGKIFSKSEGAIVYIPDEARKDINTSVFINSEGNPTYLAKDIGLLALKFEKYNPDLSIYIVDNEQTAHFKSVFDAGGKINKKWQEKSVHVSHGRMTFKGKKMSSRLGGVPSGEEVINAVLDEVKEKGKESGERFKDFTEEEKEKLQREIALSALRVSILRSKPGVNIDFDPDRATSFEGDSGPYLCYTHARCCSLLEKGGDLLGTVPLLYKERLGEVERKVFQFEKIIIDSAEEIAPQKLIKYLFELAGEFNNFYAHNKIIDENDLEKTTYNLYLTTLVQQVLKKGLHLIGVEAPLKM